jgi:hypothetical protein
MCPNKNYVFVKIESINDEYKFVVRNLFTSKHKEGFGQKNHYLYFCVEYESYDKRISVLENKISKRIF